MSVALVIYFAISCSGGITGAALNPTVGFVNVTFVAMVGSKNYLSYLPSYAFGCSLGGVLAALFCKYVSIPAVPAISKPNEHRKTAPMNENVNYSSFDSLSDDNRKSLMATLEKNKEDNS